MTVAFPGTVPTEHHVAGRVGWLRAAVLGADDGVISTSSLVVGVAAAGSTSATVLLAAVAGAVAGALSMAAGEYVSVSSQADAERADLARERVELASDPGGELAELTEIYHQQGISPALARQVAVELTAGNPLTAHAREELGIMPSSRARPVQAAMASAASFAAGAVVPVVLAVTVPAAVLSQTIAGATLVVLFLLGVWAARAGGAPSLRAGVRVAFWGGIAMAGTALIGRIIGH